MRQNEPGRGDPIGPLDWLRLLPDEAAASSDRLGWVGLQAARCRAEPAFELNVPPLPTTGSSFSPARRKNWICCTKG
jgi:hypothetical protein